MGFLTRKLAFKQHGKRLLPSRGGATAVFLTLLQLAALVFGAPQLLSRHDAKALRHTAVVLAEPGLAAGLHAAALLLTRCLRAILRVVQATHGATQQLVAAVFEAVPNAWPVSHGIQEATFKASKRK